MRRRVRSVRPTRRRSSRLAILICPGLIDSVYFTQPRRLSCTFANKSPPFIFHGSCMAFINDVKSGSSFSQANLGSTLAHTSQLERSSKAFRIQAITCSLSL